MRRRPRKSAARKDSGVSLLYSQSYIDKVLSVQSPNLAGLWLQNDNSGSVSHDASGLGHDGAYTTVTLGVPGIVPGITAGRYDGTNDYNDIYSASLNTAFSGAEGTLMTWAKVSAAGVWQDGAFRFTSRFEVDAENKISIDKTSANNTIRWFREASNAQKTVSLAAITTIGWMCLTMSWSITNDQLIAYYNGAPTGTPQTSLAAFVGNLDSGKTLIGADDDAPTNVWSGDIGPVALWNTPLSATEIRKLAKV